jgi:hypothetical protein
MSVPITRLANQLVTDKRRSGNVIYIVMVDTQQAQFQHGNGRRSTGSSFLFDNQSAAKHTTKPLLAYNEILRDPLLFLLIGLSDG